MSLLGSSSSTATGYMPLIHINGTAMPDRYLGMLVSVDVDTSIHMPSQIRLMFRGPTASIIEDCGFTLGVELSLEVGTASDSGGTTVFTGEMTGVDLEFGPEGQITVIRGLDKSHRLMMGTSTKAYQQMTASDVVSNIVSTAGLTEGQVDATDSTYAVLGRPNVSDWVYIQQLADISNRVAYFLAGKIYFVANPTTDTAPESGSMGSPTVLASQLVMGRNLFNVRASITAAEQVTSVEVRGWDPSQKQSVVGVGSAGASMFSNSEDPTTIAGTFGGKTFVETMQGLDQQTLADTRAQSIAADIGNSMFEMEGECFGDPGLVAGTAVSLGGCGDPFDGKYVLTAARHSFVPSAKGYSTWFTVGGRRNHSLLALSGGGTFPDVTQGRIPGGMTTAIVSSITDPENLGRVQLKFPWLDETYVSGWSRVLQIGSGSGWGNLWMPEVNSEVLVAFDRGDINYPYVLGGVYNGQDALSPQASGYVDTGSGAFTKRLLQSRTKHTLLLDDTDSAPQILLQTGDTNHSLTFAQSGQGTVTLKSNGDITVQGQNITITAEQNLQLEGQSQLSLKSPQIQISADAELQIASQGTAELSASATLDISGSMTSINSG